MSVRKVKTGLFKAFPGIASLLRRYRPKYARRRRRLAKQSLAEVFTDIYDTNYWGCSESVSGRGSSLASTRALSEQLPHVIRELGVKTMLDAPCGDFYWMQTFDLPLDQYIGADIVPQLVEKLDEQYATANRRFQVLNLLSDPLPSVDLVFCRDCMLHFSFEDCRQMLENIKRSQFRYLMLSHCPEVPTNRDIVTGEARYINLMIPPFRLPEPIRVLDDSAEDGVIRQMLIWPHDQIANWEWEGFNCGYNDQPPQLASS